MDNNTTKYCPFYRFPSDEGFPNYQQSAFKIENIRKKVGNLQKIADEKLNLGCKITINENEKTKSQRQFLISTAEKQLSKGKHRICQLPKIKKKQKKVKEDLENYRKDYFSVQKISSYYNNSQRPEPQKEEHQKHGQEETKPDQENKFEKNEESECNNDSSYTIQLLIKPKSIYIVPFEEKKSSKGFSNENQKMLTITNEKIDNSLNFYSKKEQKDKKCFPPTFQKNQKFKLSLEKKKCHSSNKFMSKDVKNHNKLTLNIKNKGNKNTENEYCRFLDFIGYSFGICLKNIKWTPNILKVYVGEGNNSNMIFSILKRRNWWILVPSVEEAHFVWTQSKNMKTIQSLSHFKKTKVQEKQGENQVKRYLTFGDLAQKLMVEEEVKTLTKTEKKSEKFIFDRKNLSQFTLGQELCFLRKRKIHNHFIGNFHLTQKKLLYRNIKNYQEKKGINPFQFIPLTFHVKQFEDNEWNRFNEQFASKNKNLWIIKPGQNSNRGLGIKVQKQLAEIRKIVQQNQEKQKKPRTTLIQSYITPLLYYKRKFDFRCFLLVMQIDNRLKGFWYEEGYIRTSSKQFSAVNIKDKYIHLTNDSVQKKCESYGKYEIGNKLSFGQLQNYLTSIYGKTNFNELLYQPMIELTVLVLEATYQKLNPSKKDFCFEIFGLDFMLDENFKIWLIEVNSNPCLQTPTTLLYRIISSMVENAFRIAVDPFFRTTEENIKNNKCLEKDPFKANKFHAIFSKNLLDIQENNSAKLELEDSEIENEL